MAIETTRLRLGDSVAHAHSTLATLGWFAWRAGQIGFVSIAQGIAPPLAVTSVDSIVEPTGRDAVWVHSPAPLAPEVGQPSPGTRVARLTAFNGIIAFAELLPDIPWEGNLVEGNEVSQILSPSALEPNTTVRKLGARSGITTGIITAPEMNVSVASGDDKTQAVPKVIEVSGSSEAFCQPGDGGALVFTPEPLAAVGIIIAATEAQWGIPQRVVVLPLSNIMRQFGLTATQEADAVFIAQQTLRDLLTGDRWKFRSIHALGRSIDDQSEGYTVTRQLLRSMGARPNLRLNSQELWTIPRRRRFEA